MAWAPRGCGHCWCAGMAQTFPTEGLMPSSGCPLPAALWSGGAGALWQPEGEDRQVLHLLLGCAELQLLPDEDGTQLYGFRGRSAIRRDRDGPGPCPWAACTRLHLGLAERTGGPWEPPNHVRAVEPRQRFRWGPHLCTVVSAACASAPELLRVQGGASAGFPCCWFEMLLCPHSKS